MPKNALFLLKNRKNRRALGVSPSDPHWPPAADPKQPPDDEFLVTRLRR